jgi:hypothetical protein
MNLHQRSLYLQSIITESLNIESFEYCYLIPILAQTAEFWGDVRLTSTCNIMSRQVKQYFNHTAYVHVYIADKYHDLEKKLLFHEISLNIDKNMKIETRSTCKDLDYYKSKNPNLQIQNNIPNQLTLGETSFFPFDRYQTKKNRLLKSLNQIDKKTLEIFKRIEENLDREQMLHEVSQQLFPTNIRSIQNDNSYVLLKSLRYRKLWKAHRWYPLLAKIAYNEKMIDVSDIFVQMSRSEKEVSSFLMHIMQG